MSTPLEDALEDLPESFRNGRGRIDLKRVWVALIEDYELRRKVSVLKGSRSHVSCARHHVFRIPRNFLI